MKTSISIILLVVFGFLIVIFFLFYPISSSQKINSDSYLRIHIRANSNLDCDQKVKYQVKDEIIKVLTPILCDVKSKEDAIKTIDENIFLITETADKVLGLNGFNYKSRASIKSEFFPTRSYDNLTLESDFYDALIIELGSGLGNNWWCVVYPPMCFVDYKNNDATNIEYRFKMLEIIKNFFK